MMTATKTKWQKAEKLFRSQPGNPTWEVKSETKFPTFCGEVTEETVPHGHGGYTTDEVFRNGYLLDGWLEAGYRMMKSWKEDDGWLMIRLKNGPVEVTLDFKQYN